MTIRKTGLDSLDDGSTVVVDTQSVVFDTQPDVSFEDRVTGIDSVFPQTDLQQQEVQLEAGMIPILSGFPDNGRIVQDPKTKKLHYIADGYTSSNQDEIKILMDSASKGDEVNPTQGAISRGKQWFMEEKMPKDYAEHYGLPDWMGTVGKEAGLLGQQVLSGLPFVGEYFDESMTDSPREKQIYETIKQDYASEYPERAIPAQLLGLGTGIYGGQLAFASVADKFNKVKGLVQNAKKWYDNLAPIQQKMVQVGGTSAAAGIEGFVYGSGKGDTADERTLNALSQGGMNAMITAPIAFAFPIIGSMINRFKGGKQQVEHIATEFGIGIEAARMLKEAFESGMTLGEMIKQVERSGSEKMMVDATKAFERLLDATKGSSAGMTQKVDDAITGRVEVKSGQLQGDINTTLGVKPQGTTTVLEQVGKDSSGARGAAYTKAYSNAVDYSTPQGQRILSALQSLPKNLIDNVNALLKAEGKTTRIKYKGVDKQGNVVFSELPTTEALDLLKRSLDDIAESGKDPITGNIQDINAKIADIARRKIRDNLKELNPDYAVALGLGQGTIMTRSAIEMGSKLLNMKTTLDEVKRMVRNASKDELSGARQGVREQIENVMASAKTASGQGTAQEVKEAMAAVTLMSSRANQDKLRLILGDKTADAMFKRLDEVKKSLEVQSGVRLGSATQPRSEIYKQVDALIKGGAIKSLIGHGDIKGGVSKIRDFLTGTGEDYFSSKRAQIFDELATILTSSKIGEKGKTINQALEYLRKVSAGETLTKPQANFVVKHLKNAFESHGFAFGTGIEAQRQGVVE